MQQEEEKSQVQHSFSEQQILLLIIYTSIRSDESKSITTERLCDSQSEQIQELLARFKRDDYLQNYKIHQEGNIKIREGSIRFKKDQDSFQVSYQSIANLLFRKDKLIFYSDKSKKSLLQHIHLKYFDFKIINLDEAQFKIMIESIKFTFLTESQIEKKIWLKCFGSVRDRHINNQKLKFSPVSLIDNENDFNIFIKEDLISEEKFFQIAETGDLLLLQTENTGAKIQRLITSSKYDHVALVVRIADNIIYIFDSNADTGVTFIDWRQFIVINDLYEKVSIRKLVNVDRFKVENNLMMFMNEVHGFKYNVSLNKLFRSKSPKQKEKDEYFCSELVAKCYKKCGLMDTTKASSSFWPVHFTKELKLVKPYELQAPITIALKKHL